MFATIARKIFVPTASSVARAAVVVQSRAISSSTVDLRDTGTVKWFDPRKGFGFIQVNPTTAFSPHLILVLPSWKIKEEHASACLKLFLLTSSMPAHWHGWLVLTIMCLTRLPISRRPCSCFFRFVFARGSYWHTNFLFAFILTAWWRGTGPLCPLV